MTDPFGALGDPTRRMILELLAAGELQAGTVVSELRRRGPISQPAVSQHLKVLLDATLVRVRNDGRYRVYSLDRAAVAAAQLWLSLLVDPFRQPLDALDTEIARGRRRTATADQRARRSTSKRAVAS